MCSEHIIEYHRSVSGLAAGEPLLKINGQSLELPPAPASNLMKVELRASTDLSTWSTVATSLYGAPFNLEDNAYTLTESAGVYTVEPVSSTVHQFYRLRVVVE